MNRSLPIVVATGLFLVAFTALAENKIKRIALVLGDDPFDQRIKSGAEEEAVRLNETNRNISVQIWWINASEISRQATAIDSAIAQKPDGVAIRPTELTPLLPKFEKATKEMIEVVIIDANKVEDQRVKHIPVIGMEDKARGARVMAELASGLAQKGLNPSAAIFGGAPYVIRDQLRVTGAKDEADIRKVDVEGVFFGDHDHAVEVMKDAWTKRQGICGWAMVAGWEAFSQQKTFGWSPQKVFVVAYDDFMDDELAYVREGWIGVLLVDDVHQWGIKAVNVLYDKIVNGKSPEQQYIEIPPIRVTSDNATDFADEWHHWTR